MTDVRRSGDGIVVALSTADRTILLLLAQQVSALLDPADAAADPADTDPLEALVAISGDPVHAPDDPALLRLLPDAYGDDVPASGEFRRLMDGDLRRLKVDALRTVVADTTALDDTNGSVRLDETRAESWLQALNDIRLVLGVRLDVTEDLASVADAIEADDPRLPLLLAYDRLTWLQEGLVTALDA